MSSLAAARADGYYIPPDFDWRKHKSVNHYHGVHALRERAAKLDQGILVIRFEMPFNVWCGGCGKHIAKGVRFNAEKQQVGMYHSTKIWSFRFNTACCQSKMEIQTDPEHSDYRIVTGGMRKREAYDAKSAQVEELISNEERERIRSDAMYRTERDTARAAALSEGYRELSRLKDELDMRHADEAGVNRELRRRMREAKKAETRREQHKASLGVAEHVRLLPTTTEEVEHARLAADVGIGVRSAADTFKEERRRISRQSIFAAKGAKPTAGEALLNKHAGKALLGARGGVAKGGGGFAGGARGGGKGKDLKRKAAALALGRA